MITKEIVLRLHALSIVQFGGDDLYPMAYRFKII